jgi:hypothetical protein
VPACVPAYLSTTVPRHPFPSNLNQQTNKPTNQPTNQPTVHATTTQYFGLFKFAFLQYCYRFKGTLFITNTILKPVYKKVTAMMEKAAPAAPAAPAEAPEKAD